MPRSSTSNKKTKTTAQYSSSSISYSQTKRNEIVEERINTAARMLGMPHQLLAHNDPRLSVDADLGRVFAENMIVEAPVIYIKPGVTDFLPGKSKEEKDDYLRAMITAANGSRSDSGSILEKMVNGEDDTLQYYDHKGAYTQYMGGVNRLCHTMAILMGLDRIKVPWDKGNVTFGYYDWRCYRMGSAFTSVGNTVDIDKSTDGQGWGVSEAIESITSAISDFISYDDQYVQFYVDANASFSESAGNSTDQSKLASFTGTLEDYAKEAAFVANTVGINIGGDDDASSGMQTTIDSLINSATGSEGAMGKILGFLGNGAKQIIRGGNFQIPEIYNNSSYDKNYSFSVTASTPYGNKLAWYINVGVPMCHALGLALPIQLSANTYKSPYILKCFSPGWWNCSLGIVDSISFDSGGDQAWSIYGLPSEVKISISIKDLYSNLSMPNDADTFLQNSGMMEFLAAKCGVNMANQALDTKVKLWANVLSNNILEKVEAAPYSFTYGIRDKLAHKLLVMG